MFRLTALVCILLLCPVAPAQHAERRAVPPLQESATIPGRLVVLTSGAAGNASVDAVAHRTGVRLERRMPLVGAQVLHVDRASEAAVIAELRTRPGVTAVLHDRLVSGHAMPIRVAVAPAPTPARGQAVALHPAQAAATSAAPPLSRSGSKILTFQTADAAYNSPAGWAVRAAGGFGNGIPGGPSTGPWTTTLGAGVRVAILDSGVDQRHPDLAPNLALNLSEIDQSAATGMPSPCDDGSPQDQQGHGTWTASLAAGAVGSGTGEVAGVAPQATLLNIKVLQRMPNTALTGDIKAQCEAGQTGGMLSWVLQGINDAVAQHADVIALSLGTIVDLGTGDGAGWKAAFDRATYAAQQAGAVLVAATGNDGLDLSAGNLTELPAQARGVLAVTASTNPGCAENLHTGATCAAGPVTRPYYANHGATLNAVAAPGGSYPAPANALSPIDASGWIYGACSSGLVNTVDGLPANGQSFGCFNLGHAGYVQAMGTSASAALVAGAAALLRAAHPGWTAARIVSALRSTATAQPGMAEPLLNLPAAMALP